MDGSVCGADATEAAPSSASVDGSELQSRRTAGSSSANLPNDGNRNQQSTDSADSFGTAAHGDGWGGVECKPSALHAPTAIIPSTESVGSDVEAFSREIDEIFNFGMRSAGLEVGPDGTSSLQSSNDQAKEMGAYPSMFDPCKAQPDGSATVVSNDAETTPNQGSALVENTGMIPNDTNSASSRPPKKLPRRNSSISRRRHRNIHQMERISETGDTEDAKDDVRGGNNAGSLSEHFLDDQNYGTTSDHNSLIDMDFGPDNPSSQHSDNNTASSFSSVQRRRIRGSGGESIGSAGGYSSSAGSGHGSRGSGARLRRGRRRADRERENAASPVQGDHGEGTNEDDDAGQRRRVSSSGNAIVASLDAGMASLRRWIRSRRPSFSSGAGAASSSEQSPSSMASIRLNEEDVAALSRTGSDRVRPAAATASSTSSDPNMNVFDSNGNSGFLYYRPFEMIHVRHDGDVDSGIYGSDDESGTRSVILYPLLPSSAESSTIGDRESQHPRQRAFSEPDRARLADFFSSVYGSRAIDGVHESDLATPPARSSGGRELHQSRHSGSSTRQAARASPSIIEEETEQDHEHNVVDMTELQMQPPTESEGQTHAMVSGPPDALVPSSSPPSRTAGELPHGEGLEPATASSGQDIVEDEASDGSNPDVSDPNRQARTNWMRINQRFQCLITSVALLFSLLLFGILMAWVLLTSTYVLSLNKPCDVPLKGYFWLVTIQLALDIFRADIMKWLCRWRTDSQRHVPPRVLMYNLAYLVYAMLLLRMGIQSVFIREQTCSSTAPELFYASLVFLCLSLAAWAMIFLGYMIPFVFVAILLWRNGYFPNGPVNSSRGVMGGRRARIGTGRISEMVGEAFPNTYTNPAPSGCVERLRVVFLNEFPDSYQKECCICMMEYKEGEVIVATPCEHVFHKRCCQEWFQLSRTCPVCRMDVPEALGMGVAEGHGRIAAEGDGTRQDLQQLMRFVRRGRRESTSPGHPSVVELPGVVDVSNHSERGDGQNNTVQQLEV